MTNDQQWNEIDISRKLIWSLPLTVFVFFLVGIIVSNFSSIHITPFFKVFMLITWFSLYTDVLLEKLKNLGMAILISIIIFVALGMTFKLFFIYWILPFLFLPRKYLKLNKIIKAVNSKEFLQMTILLGITFVSYFTLEYSQPSNHYKLATSGLHIDVLYHTSIAAMLKVFGVVSHGLHGLTQLEYHFGSHVLMASASRIASLSAFQAYNYFYVFFGPLTLGMLVIYVSELFFASKSFFNLRLKLISYILLTLGTGIFRNSSFFSQFANWPNFFGSESYNISLILMFSMLSILLDKKKIIPRKWAMSLLIVNIAMMTLTKISTGFSGLAFVGAWALLNNKPMFCRKSFYNWLYFIICGISFTALFFLINPSMGDARVEPLQFVRAYVNINGGLWFRTFLFLIFHFLFPILLFLFYFTDLTTKFFRQIIPSWWILGTAISMAVGAGVVLLMYVQGGSGAYFSSISFFSSIPALLCFPSLFFFRESFNWKDIVNLNYLKKFCLICLSFIFLINAPRTLVKGIKYFIISMRYKPVETILANYISHLKSIRNDKTSEKSLVYIPRDEKYWSQMDCRGLGFFIAAISERPGLYAWPSEECYTFLCGPRFHSNGLCTSSKNLYSDGELLEEAKKLGFESVQKVTLEGVKIIK